MKVHYCDDEVKVYHGDCLEVLASLPDSSVDSVVTDPPYGLEFMGKDWDRPWAVSAKAAVGFEGREDNLTLPSHRDSRNANCRACGGRQRGAKRCSCDQPQWDRSPVADMRAFQDWCEQWAAECLRVLKPGGHLLSFGGSRTWHRLACAVEDAGFEIRDSIAWLSGSGFPKSLNVSRDQRFCQCDVGESTSGDSELCGVRAGVSDVPAHASSGEGTDLFAPVQRCGSGAAVGDVRAPGSGGAQDVQAEVRRGEPSVERRGYAQAAEGELHRPALCEVPTGADCDGTQGRLRDGASSGDGAVDRPHAAENRVREPHQPESAGQPTRESGAVSDERGPQAGRVWPICGRCDKPVVPAGLGSALKPAHEPIVVARKPLRGTLAGNVLEHGTGALNIDGCRVATTDKLGGGAATVGLSRATRHDGWQRPWMDDPEAQAAMTERSRESVARAEALGRWPTNVVLDGSAADELDRQSGRSVSRIGKSRGAASGDGWGMTATGAEYDDEGGASRFFPVFRYQAKADSAERPTVDGVAHPTVKPLELMRWLVRLVTPPGGLVLDPFAGSGTTAEACIHEHLRCITIEREADYLPLIVARLTKPLEVGFDFGGEAV